MWLLHIPATQPQEYLRYNEGECVRMSEQKKPARYAPEFRQSAVKLAVESDQPISQIAKELGVNENTLHTWISKYHRPVDVDVAAARAEPMHDELKRLRKENKRLREEREILKKAAGRMRPTPLQGKACEVRIYKRAPESICSHPYV